MTLSNQSKPCVPLSGPATKVLPLLNGLKHLDTLDLAFGQDRVLGGSCHLSVALDEDGTVRHLNQLHLLTYGPRTQKQNEFCEALHPILARAGFDTKLSPDIIQSMWDKWVLLASLGCIDVFVSCQHRRDFSRRTAGANLMLAAIEECRQAAAAAGFEPAADHIALIRTLLTDTASPVVASMFRDMQRGGRIEGDHIVGDMLGAGAGGGARIAGSRHGLREFAMLSKPSWCWRFTCVNYDFSRFTNPTCHGPVVYEKTDIAHSASGAGLP